MTNDEKLMLKDLIALWESENEDDVDEFLEQFDKCMPIFRKLAQ